MFITPSKALIKIASLVRAQRIENRLTQENLAQRSGVSLSTLRKFERTGLISLESFLKLATVLGILENVINSLAAKKEYASIDEILEANKKTSSQKVKQRVRHE